MVVIERKKGAYRFNQVFFADADEVAARARGIRPYQVTIFDHALCKPDEIPTGPVVVNPSRTTCIDLKEDPDELLRRMAHGCRRQIHLAERLGERIRIRTGEEAAHRDFLALQKEFLAWKPRAHELRPSQLGSYQKSSEVFVAYLDEQPLVAHVVVRDESLLRARVLFSVSGRQRGGDGAKYSSAINRRLHWHECLRYRSAGFSVYDFGGFIQNQEVGPEFKLSFGGYIEEGCYALVLGSLPRIAVDLRRRIRPPRHGGPSPTRRGPARPTHDPNGPLSGGG